MAALPILSAATPVTWLSVPALVSDPMKVRHRRKADIGDIYKARDTRLDRTVAIKVLPEHVATGPNLEATVRTGGQNAPPPSVIPTSVLSSMSAARTGSTSWSWRTFTGGRETLEQRLKKGALPLDQGVAGWQSKLLTRSRPPIRAGSDHRDLKPGNIMFTKTGAKLLDFGYSENRRSGGGRQSVDAADDAPKPHGGPSTIPAHVPVTQHRNSRKGAKPMGRTDIFAFGAVLFEMVTGRKAFDGKSQASLIAAILERGAAGNGYAPAVNAVAARSHRGLCLSKEPDDRWQNAADVMRELKWSRTQAPPPQPHRKSPLKNARD